MLGFDILKSFVSNNENAVSLSEFQVFRDPLFDLEGCCESELFTLEVHSDAPATTPQVLGHIVARAR